MIYIHIPYCRSFCTYCGFYSVILPPCSADMTVYVHRVVEEAEKRGDEIKNTLAVNTLYIGGGTPSLLGLRELETLVRPLSGKYGPFEEFTMEVNPEDIAGSKIRRELKPEDTASGKTRQGGCLLGYGGSLQWDTHETDAAHKGGMEYMAGLKALGVNRISMGVQSFDDNILRWMKRRHNAATAGRAFKILREAGFDNISIDLIFGLAQLDREGWEKTVEEAIELHPEHISAYQLSIEEGSDLEGQLAKGLYKEADEEQCREQYEILCQKLRTAGYKHYEVSNFALPGREARHNTAYWKRLPYVGLGAGAHSFSGGKRSWNTEELPGYSAIEEVLTQEDERVENIMLALRTAEGIDEAYLRKNSDPEAIERLLIEGGLESLPSGTFQPSATTPGKRTIPVVSGHSGTRVSHTALDTSSPSAIPVVSGHSGTRVSHTALDTSSPSAIPVVSDHSVASGSRLRIPESRFFVSDGIIRELI